MTIDELKAKFKTGLKPSEQDFSALIDFFQKKNQEVYYELETGKDIIEIKKSTFDSETSGYPPIKMYIKGTMAENVNEMFYAFPNFSDTNNQIGNVEVSGTDSDANGKYVSITFKPASDKASQALEYYAFCTNGPSGGLSYSFVIEITD